MRRCSATTSGLDVGLLTSAFLPRGHSSPAPAGAQSDRLGRKRLILAGLLIYTVVSVLFGAAQSWQELLVYRAIQGVASAMVWPPATALIGDLTPPGRRGNAIGIYNAISMSGWAIGPGVGGSIKWYAENVLHMGLLDSYRAPFYAAPSQSAAALQLVAYTVKSRQYRMSVSKNHLQMHQPFREIDEKYPGKLIIAMLFVGLSYGFATASSSRCWHTSSSTSTPSPTARRPTACPDLHCAGVIMQFAQLVRKEARHRSPEEDDRLITSLAQLFTYCYAHHQELNRDGE
jgi:MFS family permease